MRLIPALALSAMLAGCMGSTSPTATLDPPPAAPPVAAAPAPEAPQPVATAEPMPDLWEPDVQVPARQQKRYDTALAACKAAAEPHTAETIAAYRKLKAEEGRAAAGQVLAAAGTLFGAIPGLKPAGQVGADTVRTVGEVTEADAVTGQVSAGDRYEKAAGERQRVLADCLQRRGFSVVS